MKKLLVTLAFTLSDDQLMQYNKRKPGSVTLIADEKDMSITFGEGDDAVTLTHEDNDHSGFGVIDTDTDLLLTIDLDSWNNIREHAARYDAILSLTRQRKPFSRPRHPRTPRK